MTDKGALQRNKESAKRFYTMAFNEGKPREAVDKYIGEHYTQHHPQAGDGKENFIAFCEQVKNTYPEMHVRIHRAIAEDDKVVLHSQEIIPDEEEYASMHIFGFDGEGQIVEHWDVMQEIPDSMPHDNGMF